MRPGLAAISLVVVSLAFVGVGWLALSPGGAPTAVEPTIVTLGDSGSPRIWPYVAATPGFSRPTSPINLAFSADPERIERLLVQSDEIAPDANVSEVNATEVNATGVNATGANVTNATKTTNVTNVAATANFTRDVLAWRATRSAPRYLYVADAREWRPPVYQLHVGDYFGSQYHLRVFNATANGSEWTAVQAHSEHWDWFALVHRVDSTEQPRVHIEQALFDHPSVGDVSRQYYHNGGIYDAHGWATVVRIERGGGLYDADEWETVTGIAPLVVAGFGGLAAGGGRWMLSRRNQRRAACVLAAGGVLLGIRVAGLLAESAGIDRQLVSMVLYAVLVAGVPLAAVSTGRRLPATEALGLAGIGFAVAVVVDYVIVSVAVIPIGLVVHRAAAAVAVGVLAATAADQIGRRVAAWLFWTGVVLLPHLVV